MLVGDHECMAAVQEAPGMREWGWAAVRASEESQDCWCLLSLTHSGDLGGVASVPQAHYSICQMGGSKGQSDSCSSGTDACRLVF